MTLEDAARCVRLAARALGRHGLVHAYGHCSMRLDAGSFLVSPPRPLGLVEAGEPCTVVPLDGALPEGVLGEVRIHREIYRRRPDVGGVVRSMPPKAMSLGSLGLTPRARHGFGSYFFPGAPLWPDPQLVRSDHQASEVARQLGEARAIALRGNGLVTAGGSLEEAVVLTWYFEDAARVELDCRAAGLAESLLLNAGQAQERATWSGRIRERMWEFLTAGDCESAFKRPE
ncbi:class II aldolase/adducin family protein [Xanthobacter sp. KR7-65]|uniref:class II aldolase/adducin family protein n=1 Tax=Xanthobacter sp. KR7-65 TaxID=3156612 RepID=UPI0032B5279D